MSTDGRISTYQPSQKGFLLANNLDQHSLSAAAIKLAIEYLFPRTEIQTASADGDDNFPAHDLPLEMGVGIIFACFVVAVPGYGFMRGELF